MPPGAAAIDTHQWRVRHVVVSTGDWFAGPEVLLSPRSVVLPSPADRAVAVPVNRGEVEQSPGIEALGPIARQRERDIGARYGLPDFAARGGVWGLSRFPFFPALNAIRDAALAARHSRYEGADEGLRSVNQVAEYDIEAPDACLGPVEDLLFAEDEWSIPFVVVDTVNWWPGGRQVRVATSCVDGVDWGRRKLFVPLTLEGVERCPPHGGDDAASRAVPYRREAGDWS